MNSLERRWGALAALVLIASGAVASGQEPATPDSEEMAAAAEDREPVSPLIPFLRGNNFRATILVSNEASEAPVVDPLPGERLGDRGERDRTVVGGQQRDGVFHRSTRETARRFPLEVQVPGAPTGTVFNGGTQFQLAAGVPARSSLRARTARSRRGTGRSIPNAVVVFTEPGSNYKGLALPV